MIITLRRAKRPLLGSSFATWMTSWLHVHNKPRNNVHNTEDTNSKHCLHQPTIHRRHKVRNTWWNEMITEYSVYPCITYYICKLLTNGRYVARLRCLADLRNIRRFFIRRYVLHGNDRSLAVNSVSNLLPAAYYCVHVATLSFVRRQSNR